MNDDFSKDNKLMTIFNCIYFTFGINFCFLITSLPLTIYVFFFKTVDIKLIFLLFTLCGPSLTALFASGIKLSNGEDLSVFKIFFRAYKSNFKQSIILSLIQGIILFIMSIDMKFFLDKKILVLYYLFLFLIFFTLVLSLFLYPILSRFEISLKNLVKLSIFFSVKKLYILLIELLLIILIGYMAMIFRTIYLFFGIGITCLLILKLEQPVFSEIEEMVKKSD